MSANSLKDREELFETMPVPKAVAKLALPTLAACIVMLLYNLADTFFVGLLNDPLETGAVTLGAPVILAFNAVTNLFGTGCSSKMSRALGVKEYDTVRRSSAFGFYGAVISGAVFSLLATVFRPGLLHLLGAGDNVERTASYLFWTVTCGAIPSILNVVMANLVRAEGSAMHAGVGTMSGCLLNILLDPLFILPSGLGLGAAGAGCATFISNCCACLYFFILLFIKRGNTFVCISPKMFRSGKALALDICSVGVPASIQNLLNVTGMTVLNNLTAAYGSEAVSAVGIAHKMALIPLYVSMGISQGVMPLVGYNYSSGNRGRMKESVRVTEAASVIIMVLSALGMYFGAAGIIRAFMKNALTVEYGAIFLRGFVLAMPFLGLDFLAVAVFQACGMGRRSLIFAIFRKIILEIPATLILNRLFPLKGLAYAQFTAEFILSIAAMILLEKILRETPANTLKNA